MKHLLEKYSGHINFANKPSPLIAEGPSSAVSEEVCQKLRNDVLSGIFEPVRRLSAGELAVQMGVNPAHVREALMVLESESLVNFHPSRGYTVASFTLDDLKEIYYLRSLLEGAASELAAKNLTGAELDQLEELCKKMASCLSDNDLTNMPMYNASFHQVIYQAARSPRLYGMILKLWNGFLKSSLSCLTLRAKETVVEHRAIYEALRDRNPEEARDRTREHIVSVLGDLSEYWGSWLLPLEEK
ncbi:MAG: GntR family transcriptional regulator [Desulfocucumaceae bacterium]